MLNARPAWLALRKAITTLLGMLVSCKRRLRAYLLRLHGRWRSLQRQAEPAIVECIADCRYCGQINGQHWNIGRLPVTYPGVLEIMDYQLQQCANCDVVYLDPLPSEASLQKLYSQSSQFSDPHYSDPLRAVKLVDYYAKRLRTLGLTLHAGECCLEIGAGLAWISRALKQHNAATITVAQDVSGECAYGCPWVDDYRVSSIDALDGLPSMALISLTHVIEHVPDPNRTLRQLFPLLRAGGKVFITAPYRPALWKTSDGMAPWRDYSYLHVPAHIAYLSERWMRIAAGRAGFELLHWEDDHDGCQAFEAVLIRPA